MTAVANGVWTAAQWNVHVRDNLLMTAPGVATAASRWIVSAGWNKLAEREPRVGYVAAAEFVESTEYTDADTPGPIITTITAGRAIVSMGARIGNTIAGAGGKIAVDVSGASSLAASDLNCFYAESGGTTDQYKASWFTIYDEGLEAGENIFTLKYRAVGGGTAIVANRVLLVLSF